MMSKSALINQLQMERSWIEGMLSELTGEQMEAPGVEGNWSVKDIIAHLTEWERRGTQWIEWVNVAARGEDEQLRQAGYSAKDLDRLNLETYQKTEKDHSAKSFKNSSSRFHFYWNRFRC